METTRTSWDDYFLQIAATASGAHWSYACSAGFVAKIGLTR